MARDRRANRASHRTRDDLHRGRRLVSGVVGLWPGGAETRDAPVERGKRFTDHTHNDHTHHNHHRRADDHGRTVHHHHDHRHERTHHHARRRIDDHDDDRARRRIDDHDDACGLDDDHNQFPIQ